MANIDPSLSGIYRAGTTIADLNNTNSRCELTGEPIFSDRQNIPNAADIDCDARLDLMLGRTVGTITRYEAVDSMGPGVPRFAKLTDQFEGIQIIGATGPQLPPVLPPGGSRHGANTMAFADHDGDGDPADRVTRPKNPGSPGSVNSGR